MPPRNGATTRARRRTNGTKAAQPYKHSDATSLMRPEIGAQTRFKKKLPPAKYRYDDSLAPSMEWDGQNSARDKGEWLLRMIEEASALPAPHHFSSARELKNSEGEVAATVTGLRDAVAQLKALCKPFLNWSGKAERTSFDVPSLPLFIHERLSTKAILETLKGHKRDKQIDMFDLFGDPQHSVTDQTLRAYEYQDEWVNRMILGDSLVVMNSLLRFEQMGGQVQMIYVDPPYGVKFGSNFQPFVRKRDVRNDDEDMTREPEMVQAYRDTWELGLHSYLTYLRDRLLLARDLLAPSGSIFVQISDENLHHVRELMDEVFGETNAVAVIAFAKTSAFSSELLSSAYDYLLWFAKDKERVKYRPLWQPKRERSELGTYSWIELEDGTNRRLTAAEMRGDAEIPPGRRFRADNVVSPGATKSGGQPVKVGGKDYLPSPGTHWKTTWAGMNSLVGQSRIVPVGKVLAYKRFESDFPLMPFSNVWDDTILGTFSDKYYVVQTSALTIQRCMLMTTDPGDLVLDPTCGSGTTAYVAEQWGRRWITCDTSRVPLALARQRLLTATFPWYELKDEAMGPGAGFVYRRKQNNRGEEVGGIVPHVTLKSIANNEPADEEILADRPEKDDSITRVTGPFCFEATVPTPMEWDKESASTEGDTTNEGSFTERMIEILRRSPVLHLEGNRKVTLKSIRPPSKTLSLSAEALVDATAEGQAATLADAVREAQEKSGLALPLSPRPVAIVFGPESGAVNIRLVEEAAREAYQKSYTHLYVIGFAIQPNAREAVEVCEQVSGIPATYVQATPDLMMGDLLKNMRSSQIFSVCGLPEIAVKKAKHKDGDPPGMKQVELLGLDVFDPVTMEVSHASGDDVPAWFLDTDYNGMCFHVSQAFFPRTSEWDKLKKALKGEFEDSVWEHLAGTVSAPFLPGDQKQIAVKVIDDRGNELLVVKKLQE